jgi:hypothetical protein
MALLAALVLLSLSAALATTVFSAANATRRATVTARARTRAETGVTRAFAEVLSSWGAELDTLAVGSGLPVALAREPAGAGAPLLRTARVDRVAAGLYAVTVDVRAFTTEHPLARRRARLWLQRHLAAAASDTAVTTLAPPVVVTPWGFADLY